MTILVTGAGLIGTHTAKALLDQGIGVVLYDPNPSQTYIESVVGADRKLFRVERGDVRDFPRIMELILRLGVTRILHTAAVVGPGADQNPGQAFQVNVAGTWNLIEVTRIRSLARLVLVSSNSVYANADGPPDESLRENAPYHEPDSYYGASKAMAEIMALAYHRLAGVNLVICRPCAVYGRGGYVGGSKSGKAINETLIDAIDAPPGSRIEVEVPTAERVYVKDVAMALREALFVEKLTTRTYNVGSGEVVTAAMIADAVRDTLPHVNAVATSSAPDNVRLLDTTLARNELEYEPRWLLARSIPDYVAELQQLGPYRP